MSASAFNAAIICCAEFEAIRIYRMGIWNTHDLIVGAGMAALILEYTRRRYFVLFVINLLLSSTRSMAIWCRACSIILACRGPASPSSIKRRDVDRHLRTHAAAGPDA